MNSIKLTLDKNSVVSIDGDRRGARISCAKGTVNVTQQNDFKDHVLSDDESFVISEKGRVIAWAFSAATIEIVFWDADRCCLMERIRRFIVL